MFYSIERQYLSITWPRRVCRKRVLPAKASAVYQPSPRGHGAVIKGHVTKTEKKYHHHTDGLRYDTVVKCGIRKKNKLMLDSYHDITLL